MGMAEADMSSLEDSVKREIDEAVQFAEQSPEASIDDMMGSTYAP